MLNRRNFLGFGAAAVGLSSFAGIPIANAQTTKVPVKVECDVLVLGGGMAGLCAAISAREEGAKSVLLLEKSPYFGGHTIMSGAGYWIGGTDIQKKAGIDDSVDFNWQDSVNRGIAANRFLKRDTAVARLVYEEGPKDLHWLESLGVKFTEQPAQAIGNRKRVHYFAPGYRAGSPVAVKTLAEKAASLGVKTQMNTKLVALVTASNDFGSRVTGAVVETNKGEKYTVRAKQGVILATGGFANSPELVAKYHPYLKGRRSLGSKFNTGDGIVAATNIGASLLVEHNGFGMNMLFVGTGTDKSIGQPLIEVPLVIVNKAGTRFQDETKGYLAVNHMMVEKGYPTANWIFDKKSADAHRAGSLKLLFEQFKVKEYASLDELAKGEGIDAKALKQTIADYNADVAKGKDRVTGRTKLLQTIDTAPFYAFECEPRIYTSYSGLEIDTHARVLDTRRLPIPGLYAAGDVCGHLAYQANLGGGGISGIVMATVYGRIAGREAAKAKPQ